MNWKVITVGLEKRQNKVKFFFEFKKKKILRKIMENARRRTEGDFQFGRAIGEGSFSTVYVARDLETKKEFASM